MDSLIRTRRRAQLRRHLTYANILSTLTFAIVMTGTVAWAAPKVTGADIKDGTVTTKDIRNRTIRGADVAPGTIGSSRIANGSVTDVDLAAAPAATASRLTTQSVASGLTSTPVTLPTEALDNSEMHVAGSSDFVAPTAGLYMATGMTRWAPFDGTAFAFIRVENAAGVVISSCDIGADTGTGADSIGTSQFVSCLRRMHSGDHMALRVGQTSGVSRGLYGAEMAVYRIGS